MSNSPKHNASELAILGGPPAFREPLHVGRPNIGDRDNLVRRLDEMLERKWLTNDGRFVKELESGVADLVGAPHAVAFCNATLALELVLEALGVEGEVILPSFTFVATAHAVLRQNLVPVFCDVDLKDHVLDPAAVRAALTPRTGAIIGVHVWDRICPAEELEQIAREARIPLIFDAAHSFGSHYGQRRVGMLGDVEIFSLHATKFVNSFEGGIVTTRDTSLAERLRLVRNFGFEDQDKVVCLGTNAKMSEISAAMGITSIESMSHFIERNIVNHDAYSRALSGLPGLRLVTGGSSDSRNLQYVVVEVDESAAGLHRDVLLDALRAENVLARKYFYPGCHRVEPYRSMDLPRMPLPNTEGICERVLVLPTGTAVDAAAIETVGSIIRVTLENASAVKSQVVGRTIASSV